MTAGMDASQAPARGPLFHSPRGLYEFQAEGVAAAYARPNLLAIWSMGLGKTILAMASASFLFEDDEIDRVLVIAEANKIRDWAQRDFPEFTKLSVGLYYGPKRAQLLQDPPQVLVTTYETARQDFCEFKPRTKAVAKIGPLLEFLHDQRVMVVYDEIGKLRNRTSKTYKAHDVALRYCRKRSLPGEHLRVLGLTGTPVETSVVNYFNIVRLVDPGIAGTVANFETEHIAEVDFWGDPIKFKNISPKKMTDPGVTPFTMKIAPLIHRKRKSDADVREQFPQKIEEPPTFVELHPKHRKLIKAIANYAVKNEEEEDALWMLIRQLAGHPAAPLNSRGRLAQYVVDQVGEAGLLDIPSAKTEELLDWALRLGDAQAVVFTFYGQSILPLLATALKDYEVVINHGGMSPGARQRSQDAFRAGDAQIFLSSDAGQRGLNLGVGEALLHYEPGLTFSGHEQRSDRIHRVNSIHPSVNIQTLVGRGTPDEHALSLILKRQERTEDAIDFDIDEESAAATVTAADRKAMIERAKRL